VDNHIILGIHITDRLKKAEEVQRLFTQYGCHIKTRIGLHEVENVCSLNGLVILELHGESVVCEELESKLAEIEGLDVQKMVFTH